MGGLLYLCMSAKGADTVEAIKQLASSGQEGRYCLAYVDGELCNTLEIRIPRGMGWSSLARLCRHCHQESALYVSRNMIGKSHQAYLILPTGHVNHVGTWTEVDKPRPGENFTYIPSTKQYYVIRS